MKSPHVKMGKQGGLLLGFHRQLWGFTIKTQGWGNIIENVCVCVFVCVFFGVIYILYMLWIIIHEPWIPKTKHVNVGYFPRLTLLNWHPSIYLLRLVKENMEPSWNILNASTEYVHPYFPGPNVAMNIESLASTEAAEAPPVSLLQLKLQLSRNSEPEILGDSAEDVTETQLISLSMAVLEVAWISIKKNQRLQHFTRVRKIECGKLCKHNLVGGLEHFSISYMGYLPT